MTFFSGKVYVSLHNLNLSISDVYIIRSSNKLNLNEILFHCDKFTWFRARHTDRAIKDILFLVLAQLDGYPYLMQQIVPAANKQTQEISLIQFSGIKTVFA